MKYSSSILILILITGFLVRLYKIDSPVADWHSWRQADTAAVARNFEKYGFDPFRPRYDDLSNIQTGRDNPLGYRMVEFPLYQSMTFILHKLAPWFSLEITLRLINIFASLGTALFLYLILGKWTHNDKIGLFGAFFYLFLPYSIYYSRTILPETLGVFFAVSSLYFFGRLGRLGRLGEGGRLILAALLLALALLVKPTAGFLLAPAPYLFYKKSGKLGILGGLGILGVAVLPLLWWRWWIGHYPEGIPAYAWLLNGDGIRFRPAFFRWIFWERITKLISGFFLVPIFIGGTIGLIRQIKQNSPITLWGLGALAYLFLFATGNVRHDYYQIIIIPVIAGFLGTGADWALVKSGLLGKLGLLAFMLLGIYFSWQTIKTYYWINDPAIIEAGKKADKILPKDAKVIAPYSGSTAFLYQINRQGWPVGFEIEDKIKKGAQYYVNTNLDDQETRYVMGTWRTIFKNDKFVIVDLRL